MFTTQSHCNDNSLLSPSSLIHFRSFYFNQFPIPTLTTIRYCLHIFRIFKDILTPQIFGKFRQRLLCAAQSDKPQLPHRASFKPIEKKCPSTAIPIGYKSRSQSHHPINTQYTIINAHHLVGQHFFEYEVQNLQLVFASPP